MAMTLPPNVSFRSAGPIHDHEGEGYMIGFHLQYQIYHTLVNIVFLSSVEPIGDKYLNSARAEDELLRKYDEATMSFQEGPDLDSTAMEQEEAVYEEIRRWAEELCLPIFLEIAETSTREKGPQRTTLFQHLHPELVNLQIATQADGKIRVTRHGNGHPPSWPASLQLSLFSLTKSILTSSNDDDAVPSYSPEQITVVETAAVPRVVLEEGGEIICCKPNTRDDLTTQEYTRLKKIKDAGLDSLRVPSLRGLVVEEGGVVGLLLQFIEPSHSTLTAAMGEPHAYYPPGVEPEKPSSDRKAKWAAQIQKTVTHLHEIDVVWGDVKPDNILIDKEDNAWVLDFGGGWTVGWVDEDSADTKEGDLKGLEKLLEYLRTVDDDGLQSEQLEQLEPGQPGDLPPEEAEQLEVLEHLEEPEQLEEASPLKKQKRRHPDETEV